MALENPTGFLNKLDIPLGVGFELRAPAVGDGVDIDGFSSIIFNIFPEAVERKGEQLRYSFSPTQQECVLLYRESGKLL